MFVDDFRCIVEVYFIYDVCVVEFFVDEYIVFVFFKECVYSFEVGVVIVLEEYGCFFFFEFG